MSEPYWEPLAAAPAFASRAVIFDYTVSSAQNVIDSNTILGGDIPQIYKHLRVQAVCRSDQAVSSANLYSQVNNNATANYYIQAMQSVGAAAPTSIEGLATPSWVIAPIIGASSSASNQATTLDYWLPFYTSAWAKQLLCTSGGLWGGLTGNAVIRTTHGFWNSATPLTRLNFYLVSGNFVVGSRFVLYGEL